MAVLSVMVHAKVHHAAHTDKTLYLTVAGQSDIAESCNSNVELVGASKTVTMMRHTQARYCTL